MQKKSITKVKRVKRKHRKTALVHVPGPFEKGGPGGPGRPKGKLGGRALALLRLDKMLARSENLDKLDGALQAEFDLDPVLFFKQIVMPLIPKNQVIKLEGAEKLPVRITMPGQTEGAKQ